MQKLNKHSLILTNMNELLLTFKKLFMENFKHTQKFKTYKKLEEYRTSRVSNIAILDISLPPPVFSYKSETC